MKISIVMPAYNEEKRIGKTLKSYSEFFSEVREKTGLDYQILVVINATTDKTEDIVKSFMKKDKNIAYLNLRQGGKGFAINQGFKESLSKNFDLIGFADADMAASPKQFYRLITSMGSADGSISDRYLPESQINPPHSFRRLIVSRVYNFIARVLFQISYKDTQCGYKMFKRKTIEKILPELVLTNWAYDINILYLCKKYSFKINSVPVVWYEIGGGSLNIIKSSIQMFFATFQLRILNSPLKRMLKTFSPIISRLYSFVKNI